MDDKLNLNYVLESQGARFERINKRLFVLAIVLSLIIFVSNGLWLVYEFQFADEIQIEQEVDTGEGDAFINGIGDFTYGESKTDNN